MEASGGPRQAEVEDYDAPPPLLIADPVKTLWQTIFQIMRKNKCLPTAPWIISEGQKKVSAKAQVPFTHLVKGMAALGVRQQEPLT